MRVTDKTLFDDLVYKQLDFNGSVTYSSSQIVYGQEGYVQKSDVVGSLPDSSGWRAPNDYSVVDVVTRNEFGHRSTRTTDLRDGVINGTSTEVWTGPATWIGSFDSPRFNPGTWYPDNAFELLVNQCLLKLRDQKVNLALSGAELSKTADGISSALLKITTSYRAFRRGDFKKSLTALGLSSRRRGRDAASTWLEIQYGILPLMSDIHGSYEELTRKTRQHGQRIRVMRRSAYGWSDSDSLLPVEQQGYTGSLSKDWERKYQLVLWYEVDNPELLAASSVGLTNPLEIIWELIPWSFVFDWFLSVGDFLGALTASQGMKFLGGSFTTTTVQHEVRELQPKADVIVEPQVTRKYDCSGKRVTEVKVSRRIAVLVAPEVSLPNFQNPLSLKRALNAIALLRTLK